jgi:hypothetical protein
MSETEANAGEITGSAHPSHEDMMLLSFGLMDPGDWAADLSTRLLRATKILRLARNHCDDPSKDISDTSEAEDLKAIRLGVGQFLSELHVTLSSMPMMQQQPEILEALKFILAGIAGIDRGVRAEWLMEIPTKKHFKPLEKEGEWVPIIAALELLLLDARFGSVHASAKQIVKRTGRALGTIKDWHQKLYLKGKEGRPVARAAIQQELQQMQVVLNIAPMEDRRAIIDRRVSELLNV